MSSRYQLFIKCLSTLTTAVFNSSNLFLCLGYPATVILLLYLVLNLIHLLKVDMKITYISLYASLWVKIPKLSSQHKALSQLADFHHLVAPSWTEVLCSFLRNYYYSLSSLSLKVSQVLRKEKPLIITTDCSTKWYCLWLKKHALFSFLTMVMVQNYFIKENLLE